MSMKLATDILEKHNVMPFQKTIRPAKAAVGKVAIVIPQKYIDSVTGEINFHDFITDMYYLNYSKTVYLQYENTKGRK